MHVTNCFPESRFNYVKVIMFNTVCAHMYHYARWLLFCSYFSHIAGNEGSLFATEAIDIWFGI